MLDKNGDYVTSMSFEDAFVHHVGYVYCRAKGFFSARMGSKPEFVSYVRGTPCTHQ